MSTFNPVGVASTVLATLSSGLHSLGGAAAAIVVVTVLVRLLLHPLTRAAVRGERGRTRLAPRVAEITRKHRGDPMRSAQATRELYRAEGISPFAGILPVLIQIPFFLVLYRLFSHATGALAGAHLLGVPLSARLVTGLTGPAAIAVFGVLVLALAALAWGNSRRAALVARTVATATPPAAPAKPGRATTSQAAPPPPAGAGKAGRPATAQAGRPATAQAGRPVTAKAGRPATAQAGRPVTTKAGRPATAQDGRPATAQAGRLATAQAGKPVTAQDGRPLAVKVGKVGKGGKVGSTATATAQVAQAAPAPDLSKLMALAGRYGPYLLLISGAVLPLAAGIYLVTTTAWSLAENTLLRRGLP